MKTSSGAVVSLGLPPDPDLLHMVRSLTTSAGSMVDMPVDVIDDLCIAVNEAATALLSAGGTRSRLTVRFELEEREVAVVVSGDGEPFPWPPMVEGGFVTRVLTKLTDGHRLEMTPSGPQVLLRKTMPALHDEKQQRRFWDHLALADQLAHRFGGRGVPLDDLRQVASLGLIKASQRFEPERGVPFRAYATATMKGEIKRHFRDQEWTVKVPRELQELSGEIGRVVDELTQRLGRAPTVNEIAAAADLRLETVVDVLAASTAYQPVELDGQPDGESDADPQGFVDSRYESVEALASMEPGLARLSPRAKEVVLLRFALDLTQRQIAARVGISQMHVSRLLANAMRLLRQWMTEDQSKREGGA